MEEPRPKRPKPTPSMAPDTDTVCGLRATIIEKEKEIKKLKDSLKAAARTISGDQVIIEEFQKRIERMLEDCQKRFLLMMEDRGRLIRCLGARSPYTVVDPAGDGTAATPTTNATSSRQASARVPAALAGGDDTAAIATTNATSSQ